MRQQNQIASGSLPLAGKTILVTRATKQAEEFCEILRDYGATVLVLPTIEIIPPASWEECDRAILSIDQYAGIILTSSNAAESFLRRAMLLNKPAHDALRNVEVFAVGVGTRNSIDGFGVNPKVFSAVTNSAQLADALVKHRVKENRYLFPKGDLTKKVIPDVLRSHGATVDEVIVYRTIAPRDFHNQSVHEMLKNGKIDLLTFFSPSSIQNFVELMPARLISLITTAVIGTTTAAEAKHFGLQVHIVPDQPTSKNLADAIVGYYGHEKEVL
jgi:uroporphyrinogen III methyltransferase/synthase